MIKFIKELINTIMGNIVWDMKMSDSMGLTPIDDNTH